MIYETHKQTLKNGLRVVTVPIKNTNAITAYLFVGTGSHHEQKELSGISHYLEHLFFKGSKKYKTAYDIATTLESVGVRNNAFTSQECTAFYVETLQDYLDIALDVMSDFLKHPLFTEDEIEREKGVILEELNMYRDMPSRRVFDVLQEALYGDQPAGRDIGGTPETVKSTTKKDVVDYFEKQYKADNMTLVFAGNITPEQGTKLARKYFDAILVGKNEIVKRPVAQLSPTAPTVQIEEKQTDQTHLAIGFPAFPMTDDRRYALHILAVVLGSGMSSRLFTEVREKQGLCYAISATNDLGTDFGSFDIYSGIAKGKTDQAIKTIVQELNKTKQQGITKQELQKAQNIIKATLLLGLEESYSVASYWGRQEILCGEIELPREYLEKINNTTLKEVQSVANDIFVPAQARLAMVSPKHEIEPLCKLFLNL